MRPDFRNFVGSGIGISMLLHSAKGTTWNEHKYIKRIDGTYYYPDSYEGGRHLPSSDSSNKDENRLEDWEKTMYKDINETLRNNPGLFDVSQLTDDNWQNFRTTLAEFAGVDTDSLSDAEVERMRGKVKDYYSARSLGSADIEKLANEVIRGNFGNGQVRKDLLGANYQEVQDRVNEIVKSAAGSQKISDVKENKAVASAVASVGGLDLETVYSVYRKKP